MTLRRWAASMIAASGLLAAAPPVHAGTDPIGDVRMAKIGLTRFLLDHVDRPLRVADACPALPAHAAAQHLELLGLSASERVYGAAVVWERSVGSGLVALRCGNDLAQSSQPAEAVRLSLDVMMLDGQATFAQCAVDLAGNDVVIVPVEGSANQLAARCTNGGRDCEVAVEIDDFVVTIRLRGLPADTGDGLARQLALAVLPDIVANLAAHGQTAIDG